MIIRALILASTLLAAAASITLAQAVRGTVVHADSTTVAAGVIVQLLDDGGTIVARSLSSARGEFSIRASRAGTHRVRALRIGFRPTTTLPFQVPADSVVTVRVLLSAEAVVLPLVTVRGRTACRLRPDSALAVTQAWEEARKALTAASLTAEAERFVSTVATYERAVDAEGIVAGQRTSTVRTTRPRVFESLPADSLQRVGYIEQDGERLVYFGPDADVLLSEPFVATHCLRLEPAPGGDTASVAVGFEPTQRPRDLVDVSGSLVLDRRTSELRYLEFRYAGLPRAATEAGAGGRVEFARLPGGAWFVSRWILRMPVMSVDATAVSGRVGARSDATVDAMRLAGGELLRVTLDDSVVHEGSGRAVDGRVVAEQGRRGIASARAFLSGTDYSATTDTLGRFRIADIIPGRYRLGAASGELNSLGIIPTAEVVDLRTIDVAALDVAIPSAERMFADVCHRAVGERAVALLRGSVHDEDTGAPIPEATVLISWDPDAPRGTPTRPERRRARTGADGAFRFCGVPRGTRLTVQAEAAGSRGQTVGVHVPLGRPFAVVRLTTPSRKE